MHAPNAFSADRTVHPERLGPTWRGIAVHVGPMLAYVALVAHHGLTVRSAILDFAGVAFVTSLVLMALEILRPARALRAWSLRESAGEIAWLFLESFALGYLVTGGAWWLASRISTPVFGSAWVGIALAILTLDFLYYLWHRFVLHGRGLRWAPLKAMRRAHARHHDVEDLDLFRGNVFSRWDAAFSHQASLGLICGLYGLSLPAMLVAFSLTMLGFASHHVNHTLHLGPLRYLFVDNHVHKLHHCRGGGAVNHGNFFSIWDRLFGTYFEDHGRCATMMHEQGIPVRPSRRDGPARSHRAE